MKINLWNMANAIAKITCYLPGIHAMILLGQNSAKFTPNYNFTSFLAYQMPAALPLRARVAGVLYYEGL